MVTRLRIPKSPDELRAAKARRQKRWRQNAKQRAAVAANVDHALGVDDGAPPPDIPKMAKGDLARLVHDRIEKIVGTMTDEQLLDKEHAPAITLGLKAGAQIDAREKSRTKQGNAELAWAILGMLTGGVSQPLALDDGRTLEGEFVPIEDDDGAEAG